MSEALDRTFAGLERAAIAGERCPASHSDVGGTLDSGQINQLARAGRILIEISGKNYRTVTILVGPHAGKKTAPDPSGGRIWQTIGVTKTLDTTSTRRPDTGPSAPRDYSVTHGLRDLRERR